MVRIIGSASMFIYLSHVNVIFAVTQFLGSGTIASLAVGLPSSAAAGVALKALHGRIRFTDLLLQLRESRFLE